MNSDSPAHRHLVFIHGGGVGPWMWRRQREHFGAAFTVHTPTLPGHDPASDDTYTSHADAAHSIAKQVGLDQLGSNVTVIGFSVGGQVAIEFTAMFPELVARSVVVSSLVKPWRAASLLAQTSAVAAPLARSRRFARLQAKQLYLPDEDFDDYFALSISMSNCLRRNSPASTASGTEPLSPSRLSSTRFSTHGWPATRPRNPVTIRVSGGRASAAPADQQHHARNPLDGSPPRAGSLQLRG